ncbi:MAG: hypothetical protein ACRDXX_05695 [Stackebrandtia sp.]
MSPRVDGRRAATALGQVATEVYRDGLSLARTAGDSVAAVPTLYMFDHDPNRPYLGSIKCRPCRPGHDAHAAVRGLGLLPAARRAESILIAWEAHSLAVHLREPDEAPVGVVAVHADADGGYTTMQVSLEPRSIDGDTSCCGDYLFDGTTVRIPKAVAQAITMWTDMRGCGDADDIAHELGKAGYGVASNPSKP